MNYDQKTEDTWENTTENPNLDYQGYFSEKVIFALRLRDEWEKAD